MLSANFTDIALTGTAGCAFLRSAKTSVESTPLLRATATFALEFFIEFSMFYFIERSTKSTGFEMGFSTKSFQVFFGISDFFVGLYLSVSMFLIVCLGMVLDLTTPDSSKYQACLFCGTHVNYASCIYYNRCFHFRY